MHSLRKYLKFNYAWKDKSDCLFVFLLVYFRKYSILYFVFGCKVKFVWLN